MQRKFIWEQLRNDFLIWKAALGIFQVFGVLISQYITKKLPLQRSSVGSVCLLWTPPRKEVFKSLFFRRWRFFSQISCKLSVLLVVQPQNSSLQGLCPDQLTQWVQSVRAAIQRCSSSQDWMGEHCKEGWPSGVNFSSQVRWWFLFRKTQSQGLVWECVCEKLKLSHGLCIRIATLSMSPCAVKIQWCYFW